MKTASEFPFQVPFLYIYIYIIKVPLFRYKQFSTTYNIYKKRIYPLKKK